MPDPFRITEEPELSAALKYKERVEGEKTTDAVCVKEAGEKRGSGTLFFSEKADAEDTTDIALRYSII